MTSVVSARRRFIGWRALAVLVLAAASLPAAAQSMACGTYKQDDGNAILTLESEGHGFLKPAYSPTEELRIARSGTVLGMVNLATGHMENWTFGEGDRTLTGGYHDFVRDQAAACKPFPAVQEGSCRADPVGCLENYLQAQPVQLRQWCREEVPVACKQLLELYERQANEAAPEPAPPFPKPAQCDEAAKGYDPVVCLRLVETMAGEMMGKAVMGLSRAPQAVLPAEQLVELADLCRQHPREAFCQSVAQAQWNAGRLLEARDALQHACSERTEAQACGLVAPLVGLPAAALSPVAATTLPCGSYVAARGLPSAVQFGDAGVVQVTGYATRLRARAQDGRIHLRRDIGDDIVLQTLRDGSLAGMDGSTRFAHYTRQPDSAGACTAPLSFVEIPQPLDCPTLDRKGGAEACCKAGQLLGCKLAASARVREDDWTHAQPYYAALCTAGVREGCVGLAEVYEHTADEAVPTTLKAICAKGGPAHIACDVDATRDWPALRAMVRAMAEEAARRE
ncbi:hypothetical protein KQ945_00785 [Bacillus subtilis subsp. subtilis]|nr:hypothetical protein [Bacillus subtilis subsp. subtilis]